MAELFAPHRLIYEPIVRAALAEDLGRAGDITTEAIVPAGQRGRAMIVAREPARVAGLAIGCSAFTLLDESCLIRLSVNEGADVEKETQLATIEGPVRALLTGERTALNLLGRLCGVATMTRGVVQAVEGSSTQVVCTRKTTPGLRALEKYAVRAGGGANHRFGLDDAVLIKDNHLAIARSVTEAVSRVRRVVGHMVKVEVEVETIDQLEEALELNVDAVLLDNMRLPTLREAVEIAKGRAISEASGGIRPDMAARVAATGVDLLSVGWLTHSARSIDLSLDLIC